MSAENSWISQEDLLRTDYAIIALTSTVFVARILVQAWRRRNIEWQDGWLYLGFAAFITFSVCLFFSTPTPPSSSLRKKVPKGEIQPWVGMAADLKFASEVMWSSGM